MMKKFIAGLGAAALMLTSSLTAFATFSDVSPDDFYYDAVTFLEETGIVVGYSDGTFGYDLNINRAEFMKLVIEAQFFGENTEFLNSFTDQSCFDDVPADEWYTGYVCYGKDKGHVVGYEDGTFRPAQSINFVEAMKVLLEVFDYGYAVTDIWYEGLVNEASDNNLIPLTIDDFGQMITRAEMSDMVVRIIKLNLGELDEYLGEFADDVATYESIEAGTTSEMTIGCGGPACYLEEEFSFFDTTVTEMGIFQVLGYENADGVQRDLVDKPGFQALIQDENRVEGIVLEFFGFAYFVVETIGEGGWSDLSTVYKYDITNDEADVLYEYQTFDPTPENETVEKDHLSVFAYDGVINSVVVLNLLQDWSPGPCYNPWVHTPEAIWTVGENEVGDTALVPYEDYSMEQLDAWELKVQECEENLGLI